MEFRDLEYLLAIAEYGNLTRAAQSLYISQPALTKTLQRLEEGLQLTLFEKAGRRYLPTYAGSRLLAGAERVLAERSKLEHEIAELQKNGTGLLRVGFPLFRCGVLLPAVLPAFRTAHPGVTLTITEEDSDELDESLLVGQLDLAFYNLSQPKAGLEYRLLKRDTLYAVVQKGHPLAQRAVQTENGPALRLAWLYDEVFLLLNRSQRLGQRIRAALKQQKPEPQTMEISSVRTALLLAAEGCGVAFVSDSLLNASAAASRLDAYRLLLEEDSDEASTIDFVAAWRTGAYLPQYAADFTALVEQSGHARRQTNTACTSTM